MQTNKSVYILGAGFSYPTAPCQSEILKEIIDNNSITEEKFKGARDRILKLIMDLFSTGDVSEINLEDILTILDKAILNREYIRENNLHKLQEFKNDLIYCIAYMFDEKLKGCPTNPYDILAKKIITCRKASRDDKFSFIVLNWDLLLDNAIYMAIKTERDSNSKVAIDYCTYTNEFKKSDDKVPDNVKKALGYKNIKLLKIHGSFNWLICKNCNRLLKTLNEKIILKASSFIEESTCEYCNENSLEPLIITPTLLKDLNNVHLKTVWHNAEIELMEAKRIVFVGYSFPIADFEFRYVLKRCIPKEAEIIPILNKDENANERYKTFFGSQIKDKDSYKDSSEAFFQNEFL